MLLLSTILPLGVIVYGYVKFLHRDESGDWHARHRMLLQSYFEQENAA